MAIPAKLIAPLHSEKFYHIICRSLENQKLFHSDENRLFFLERYKIFLSSYVSTYAYCLINNHVHFIVRVQSMANIIAYLKGKAEDQELTITQQSFMAEPNENVMNTLLERQFNSFFVSYTRSYNIHYKRKGHLFESPFKRILLEDEMHITQAIVYVHANAVKHKMVKSMADYNWSSYNSILSEAPTSLMREEVLQWFGGRSGFVETHERQSEYYYADLF